MKYTIQYFIFFFLVLSMNGLIAQDRPDLATANILEDLKKDAHAIVRNQTVKFDVLSKSAASYTYKITVTRLNEAASYGDLVVGYDMYSKLDKIKINLYDAAGNLIRKFKKNEINDMAAYSGSSYSDVRLKHADLVYGQYPYTIEYEYLKTYDGLMIYPPEVLQRDFSTSVEDWNYSISFPEDFKVFYKIQNIEMTPKEEATTGRKKYTFQKSNLLPVKNEAYSASAEQLVPSIYFTSNQFKVDDYQGDMSSWESTSTFFYELNKEHNNLSDELKKEIQMMVADAKTDDEKIRLLYNYVQENMRYVSVQLGIGGWRAFDAAYVEKNKFGDCKALTWFMKSMLEEVGITSYPALVESGAKNINYKYDKDFSFPDFNHVILSIPSENAFLECTSSDAPTYYIGSFTDDREVLIVSENGGEIKRTPKIEIDKNAIVRKANINLNTNGGAIIKNEILRTGVNQERLRAMKLHLDKEEIKEYFLRTTKLPRCEIKDISLELEKDYPTGTINYEVTVPHYASKSGKRIFIPLNSISTFGKVLPEVKDRQHNVIIRRGYVEKDEFVFTLPEGYSIESLPSDDLNLKSEFGEYTIELIQKSNQLTYKRNLKILPIDLPANRYNDLRDFYKKITKTDKIKLVLVESKT